MGRRGNGSWVDRAAGLVARLAELEGGCGEGALKQVASEQGLTVAMVRRYVDGFEHVRSAPLVVVSLNALEHFKTWTKLDPIAAMAARDAVLAGEYPLSRIQGEIRNARARASVPGRLEAVAVQEIIERFRAARIGGLPDPAFVNIPPHGGMWMGLSADATLMSADENNTGYLERQWALLVSPSLPGSPLANISFEALLLRVAAAGGMYDHVSFFCVSDFEREEVSSAARGWWPSDPRRLSILRA
ncbi:hypothetical protein [Lichenibacterium ramalinae]|uniref:Uncharacterized protein n=1 Tax=Lichenibacterium ramalinae TaxID=2316527 RepID=A0A4Q2RCV8_9HYPH|nr:hypothetical protein [Lichenibacterium ramalinae]RYB04465.1 hypothetical protein D3272_13600 [Lichenibacterium ramalinae]